MRLVFLAAALAVALSACARNDGLGGVYKGVRCVETGRC